MNKCNNMSSILFNLEHGSDDMCSFAKLLVFFLTIAVNNVLM